MIRAVLDTNLILSYALTKGAALSKLMNHWESGSFIFLTSPSILEELHDVLGRPKLRSKMIIDPQILLEVIEADTERTSGALALLGVCRDPKDDKFFACAVEGEADYIVSGDRDLLDIGEYAGIQIIRLLDFVSILDAS